MIRNSLLAAGLVSVGLVLVTPSIALAGPPQPVGPLVAATSLPIGPGVIVDPPKPPKPSVHPPIGPGVIVDPTKPPKPPKPTFQPPVGPDVIIDDVDPTTPPTPPAGPDDVTGNPPCPTHGSCGDNPGETPDEEQTPTTEPTPTTPVDNPGAGSGTSGGGLPVTGASVGVFVGLGLLLAAGGALLLLLARRRQVSPR